MYDPIRFMFSGQRGRDVCPMTREETLAIHDKQERECHSYLSWIEVEKCMSHTPLNPGILLFLRYHPINVRLPWILWYLGSPVTID